MSTVCLTMIVKNEEHVLARAIASALPFVDTAVIVDTGSTDATESIAVELVERLRGLVVRHPWSGFGDAKSKALELARGRADYALVLDADETLHGDLPPLSAEAHALWEQHSNGVLKFRTHRLLRLDKPWRYEGQLHEYPMYDGWTGDDGTTLTGIEIRTTQDGSRSADPAKYLKDALLLETLPATARNTFYLAQSWRDAGDHERAAQIYLQRAMMGSGLNSEEVYISLLEAGRALAKLQRLEEAEAALIRARAKAPYRCEAPALLGELLSFLGRNMPPAGGMHVETNHYHPDPTDHPDPTEAAHG